MRTYIILRQLCLVVKKNNERVCKMKDKILMTGLLFVLMAALPLGFITNNSRSSGKKPSDTENSTLASNRNAIISKAAAYCENGFCDEAMRAIAVIARTNGKAADSQSLQDDNNSDTELYKRLEKFYLEDNSLLCSKGKPVEIPVCKCTGGFTSASQELEYLSSVASPWDCFSTNRGISGDFQGVSAYGINYLCENGMSAEDALKWYLPKLGLQTAR